MPATILNLTLEQGATFSSTIAVGAGYDAYTARAKLRREFGGEVLATFACTTVSGGNTTVSLTATETAALTSPTWARTDEREIAVGVWDLELVSGATVVRARQGTVKLSREATHD